MGTGVANRSLAVVGPARGSEVKETEIPPGCKSGAPVHDMQSGSRPQGSQAVREGRGAEINSQGVAIPRPAKVPFTPPPDGVSMGNMGRVAVVFSGRFP